MNCPKRKSLNGTTSLEANRGFPSAGRHLVPRNPEFDMRLAKFRNDGLNSKLPVNQIQYPEVCSEFEVQAELWLLLKNMGLDVRGNVPGLVRDYDGLHSVFFDLAVFDDGGNGVAIIECKNHKTLPDVRLVAGRQGRRYALFGVPVIACLNMGELAYAVEQVKKAL